MPEGVGPNPVSPQQPQPWREAKAKRKGAKPNDEKLEEAAKGKLSKESGVSPILPLGAHRVQPKAQDELDALLAQLETLEHQSRSPKVDALQGEVSNAKEARDAAFSQFIQAREKIDLWPQAKQKALLETCIALKETLEEAYSELKSAQLMQEANEMSQEDHPTGIEEAEKKLGEAKGRLEDAIAQLSPSAKRGWSTFERAEQKWREADTAYDQLSFGTDYSLTEFRTRADTEGEQGYQFPEEEDDFDAFIRETGLLEPFRKAPEIPKEKLKPETPEKGPGMDVKQEE